MSQSRPTGSPAPPALAGLVAAGDVPARRALDAAWPGWSEGAGLVVAADGGAAGARRLGLRPDLVVGDFDSLPDAARARLEGAHVPLEAWPAHKDRSDLELALLAALAREPARLVLLGALGGARLDHELANLALLALPELAGRQALCLDARRRVRLLHGPGEAELAGPAGDLVTLLPWGADASGVSTAGLAYALHDETLGQGSSRGLSNVRSAPAATVALRSGALLIVETRQPGGSS
ncbi:MAG: thiamine diphosphokinase [Candidatus Limnocylindrales bacterium]